MIHKTTLTIGVCCLVILCQFVLANNDGDKKDEKKKILPKDPLYITEFDIDKLYDQWEEADEDKLPNDELEPHKRRKPLVTQRGNKDDFFKDPDKLMRASKKGMTLMAFATIDGNPTQEETDKITQRWQVGLLNAHMKCERFVIADNKAIFVFHDGTLAFDAIDYFIDQPELESYSIDNRNWYGKAHLERTQECAYDPENPSGPAKCTKKPAASAS